MSDLKEEEVYVTIVPWGMKPMPKRYPFRLSSRTPGLSMKEIKQVELDECLWVTLIVMEILTNMDGIVEEAPLRSFDTLPNAENLYLPGWRRI